MYTSPFHREYGDYGDKCVFFHRYCDEPCGDKCVCDLRTFCDYII